MGLLTRTDRQGSVDDRSDSAMLESCPSGPLIQDRSGVYTYGSGIPPPPPPLGFAFPPTMILSGYLIAPMLCDFLLPCDVPVS